MYGLPRLDGILWTLARLWLLYMDSGNLTWLWIADNLRRAKVTCDHHTMTKQKGSKQCMQPWTHDKWMNVVVASHRSPPAPAALVILPGKQSIHKPAIGFHWLREGLHAIWLRKISLLWRDHLHLSRSFDDTSCKALLWLPSFPICPTTCLAYRLDPILDSALYCS